MARRNYRSRFNESDDEQDNQSSQNFEFSVKNSSKKKSTLSFGDDLADENDVFKTKKSNTLAENKIIEDQERKRKRKEERKAAITKSTINTIKEIEKKEPEIKLSAIQKPETFIDVVVDGQSSEEEINEIKVEQILHTSSIPDATTIHLARKQRERAKQQIASVPLKDSSTCSNKPTHPTSRLVREEEDFSEEDDFHENPVFISSADRQTRLHRVGVSSTYRKAKPLTEAELKSYRQNFLDAEHGSDRDSDQEAEWESQQIHKAISNVPDPSIKEIVQTIDRKPKLPNVMLDEEPPMDPSEANLDNMKFLLKKKYDRLVRSVEESKQLVDDYKKGLINGNITINKGKTDLANLTEEYSFYKEISTYIDDLIDCFNDKYPRIVYLEKRILATWIDRCNRLVKRRRQDISDMSTEVSASLNNHSPIDKKLNEDFNRRKADRDARKKRRKDRKLSVNPGKLGIQENTTADGLSTDDEETSAEILKRQSDIATYLENVKSVFEDTLDEFKEIPLILEYFDKWRKSKPVTYKSAHIALCLSKLLGPIVKLQMISWNPLNEQTKFESFEAMKWFHDLLIFFSPETETLPTCDEDVEDESILISDIIDSVIVNKLIDIIEKIWDPLSANQTISLAQSIRKLSDNWPSVFNTQSESTTRLMKAIMKRIEEFIQQDLYIPLYPTLLMGNHSSKPFNFFIRQLNFAFKALYCVLQWTNLTDNQAIHHLAFNCIINRYILVGLASLLSVVNSDFSADTKMTNIRMVLCRLQALIDLLPSEIFSNLFQDSLSPDIPAPYSQLKRFLDQLHRQMESNDVPIDDDLRIIAQHLRIRMAEKCDFKFG